MADHRLEDTSRTTDSTEATGLITSSASLPGLANRILSSDTSATAMARFSLELRDLEAATALEALGVVPETQWPSTEALMHDRYPPTRRLHSVGYWGQPRSLPLDLEWTRWK